MVMIGSGWKFFSLGFDLAKIGSDFTDIMKNVVTMQSCLLKLLTLNVPTLCVMNGLAVAGGFIMSICCDFKLMHSNAGVCLSEIDMSLPYPLAYNKLLDHTLGT